MWGWWAGVPLCSEHLVYAKAVNPNERRVVQDVQPGLFGQGELSHDVRACKLAFYGRGET